jgi:hypothetical protein
MSQSLHLEDWAGWSAASLSPTIDPTHALDALLGKPVLPSMLRRRLDQAGKATCEILGLLDVDGDCPLVYASRHGDVASSLELLTALTQEEGLSPARFSMSVHNAVMGVYSIARKHRSPIQALGACGDEFEALMCEAQGYLAAGYSSVVAVFSEGAMPSEYAPYTESPDSPCVVGLRLTATRGESLRAEPGERPGRPTPLDVIAWLGNRGSVLNARQRWHLESV